MRKGESNRSVERNFTVNSAACHLTGIRLQREDYSDPQGEGRVQSSSCNCPGARWFATLSKRAIMKLRIDELIIVWNLRRCLLLSTLELITEEPVWHASRRSTRSIFSRFRFTGNRQGYELKFTRFNLPSSRCFRWERKKLISRSARRKLANSD